jgi:predicted P-loop ATPase
MRDTAKKYLDAGWDVVPLKPKEKRPYHKDWKTREFKSEDFAEEDNIGLRLSKYADVDLDAPEAVAVAVGFLPKSDAVFGRKSKPRSHHLYICPELTDHIYFKDYDETVLLELRTGQDHETMFPPSEHPSGERVEWANEGLPTKVSLKELKRAATQVAATAAIARHYPPEGARHEWCLSLAGALRQYGLKEEPATLVIRAAAIVARDNKLKDRLEEIKTTFRRGETDPTKGIGRLKDLAPNLVKALNGFFGDASATLNVRGFVATRSGQIINCPENVRRAMRMMNLSFRRNVFSEKDELYEGEQCREVKDRVMTNIRQTVDKSYGWYPHKEMFFETIENLADEDPYHPVRDYLKALTWDGTERLSKWLIEYCGAEDSAYVKCVSRIVLIAAVKRVFRPGCKFDELLILESDRQGIGKSSTVRALCPKEDWFSSDLPLGVDSKLVIERTAGKWIIEIEELFGITKREVDQIKGFLSRPVDGPVRGAYRRMPETRHRQFICVGTTNKAQYLRDSTGNRRFWPVKVGAGMSFLKVDELLKDRDQLWAEATQHRSESIRMENSLWNEAAAEQMKREVDDPWLETLLEVLAQPPSHIALKRKGTAESRQFIDEQRAVRVRCTSEEIYTILGVPVERRDERMQTRLVATLNRLGFRRGPIKKNDRVVKGWKLDRTYESMREQFELFGEEEEDE